MKTGRGPPPTTSSPRAPVEPPAETGPPSTLNPRLTRHALALASAARTPGEPVGVAANATHDRDRASAAGPGVERVNAEREQRKRRPSVSTNTQWPAVSRARVPARRARAAVWRVRGPVWRARRPARAALACALVGVAPPPEQLSEVTAGPPPPAIGAAGERVEEAVAPHPPAATAPRAAIARARRRGSISLRAATGSAPEEVHDVDVGVDLLAAGQHRRLERRGGRGA